MKTTIKQIFFNNFIKLVDNSIAHKISKAENDEYKKYINDRLKELEKSEDDDKKVENLKNDFDENYLKMLELQKMLNS